MLSFAELPSETCWRIIRDEGFEIMLDSGAYSAWKRGTPINLEDYMEFIRWSGIRQYINLDVVGDPEATARNQATMEAAGLKPIPVFHYGEPWEVLRQLVDRYPLVGLGGHVGLPAREKDRWFGQVFAVCPDGQFHALGLANDRYLARYGFASADSIWWLYKFRERQKHLAAGDRKAEQRARVRWLLGIEDQVKGAYQLGLPV